MARVLGFLSRLKGWVEDAVRYQKGMVIGVAATVFGVLSMALFALQAPTFAEFASVFATAFTIACASLLLGGLVGFLFGVPRTLQGEGVERSSAEGSSENLSPRESNQTGYRTNTNLEQISDWLTKILVGVGLTQISAVPGALSAYAAYTGAGLGNYPGSQVYSLALLIYYAIGGFLTSYLLTRLYLHGALVEADQAARLAQVERKLSEFERQSELDAKALSFVRRILQSGPDAETISQTELNSAIGLASAPMQNTIFDTAYDVRHDNWRTDKPKMERTLPVFKALVDSGDEDRHWYYGQLGYVLKDQRDPDWEEAEKALSRAIELRGSWREYGFLWYEYNRALCRIHLDPRFADDQPSSPEVGREILDDLRAAANWKRIASVIHDEYQDPVVNEWLTLNDVRDLG